MTDSQLERLEQQLPAAGDSGPPLHLWHPPLSGEIDIEIRADGSWWHEGGEIRRQALVRLFASILRREEDGEYYLVTPVEKWRLRVELCPLLVTDVDDEDGQLVLQLNTGRRLRVDAAHPLYLVAEREHAAAVRLEHGLSALFGRAAWYRLVAMAVEQDGVTGVVSGGRFYPLQPGT